MNSEDFKEKVTEITNNRGNVWVTLPLKATPEAYETIRILFNTIFECKQCGKCCNGTWFTIIPLHVEDYQNILNIAGEERLKEITKLADHDNGKVVCLKEPCHFLLDSKCSIYDKRPLTCKYYPLQITDVMKINVNCPAALEAYIKISEKNNLILDSEGL